MKALKLDRREQAGLASGILALLLVLALLAYIPSGPRKKYLQSHQELLALQNELSTIEMLKVEELARLNGQKILMERLAARPQNFDLFSFVDRTLRECNLKEGSQLENASSRRLIANQPMVDLSLTNVSLQDLVDFLHKIYASKNLVALYKLDQLRPASREKGLDCEMTLVTMKVS